MLTPCLQYRSSLFSISKTTSTINQNRSKLRRTRSDWSVIFFWTFLYLLYPVLFFSFASLTSNFKLFTSYYSRGELDTLLCQSVSSKRHLAVAPRSTYLNYYFWYSIIRTERQQLGARPRWSPRSSTPSSASSTGRPAGRTPTQQVKSTPDSFSIAAFVDHTCSF